MRRKDREITDFTAAWQIVADCDCFRLGMAGPEGLPYILPLNFGFALEDDVPVLYFHGAAQGQKITLLRENPRVSFEMDTGHRLVPGEKAEDHTFAYRSVMGHGTVTFLESDDDKLRGLNCIMHHYTRRSDWTVDPAMLRATTVCRLRVEDWTAKEHHVP